jgi:hypothetical protein
MDVTALFIYFTLQNPEPTKIERERLVSTFKKLCILLKKGSVERMQLENLLFQYQKFYAGRP